MGTTFTTLNLYGSERAAVEELLIPTDQLQDQNPPWLTVVPSHDTEFGNPERLCRIAKKLTKQSDAAALLFSYFDDDMFDCTLFQNGKKSASCESSQSWAKLGKKLSELFGDNAPTKAFRYASRCSSLEEQVKLLEETVGTELYVLQEDEPRTVARGDTTLQEIKAREAMLKKRPNRFRLTELALEDWPKELQYRQKLYDVLRPQWREYCLSFFLYQTEMNRYMAPVIEDIIAYPYYTDLNTKQGKLLLMNGETGERRELGPYSGGADRVVWVKKDGGVVVLIPRYLPTREELNGERQESRFGLLSIGMDGFEQWHFQPELARCQHPEFVHASKQGIITLFASGSDGLQKADSVIYRIDGETGQLLCTRTYPYQDNVHHMIYVEALSSFLLEKRTTDELILLDDQLRETRVFEGFTGSYYFSENNLCGAVLWQGDYMRQRFVDLFDLESGAAKRTPLEVSAYAFSVLKDGHILGLNERQNALTVFDRDGIVTARCKVPGTLCRVISEDGRTCLVEVRGPDTHGLVYDELFDETSVHVWRLDAVPEG